MALLDHKIPPPIVGVVIASAMWAVSQSGANFVLSDWLKYSVVIGLIVIGLCFELAGVLAFRKQRTTVNPLRPERASAMVSHGIYRMTRNPMYVGMACMLLGLAVYLSVLVSFVGPVVFVAYITQFQIKAEERVLKRLFGTDYEQYCSHVRRWL